MNNKYITTPIFYPNAQPHFGHAYTMIIGDILYRLGKLFNDDVWLSAGMDEHGQKVAKAAAEANRDPQTHVDIISESFRTLSKRLLVNPDVFIRTTSEEHKAVVLDLWNKLEKNNMLYHGSYEGWYSVSDEAFYNESEKPANSVWMSEECVFFKLSSFQDQLLELYENNPEMIWPKSARNEVIACVKGGLKDLCVTRKNTWGIQVPGRDYRIYVWIDALANYITAARQKNPDELANVVHIIGKDILRFHAIYWPAILLAAGYKTPNKILTHGWWIQGGEKMSKSLGNVIDPFELIEKYGADGIRYFCARVKRVDSDAEVSLDEVDKLCRVELLGGIGNLGQRLICLIYKHLHDGNSLTAKPEFNWLAPFVELEAHARNSYDRNDPHQYSCLIWEAASALNKYISEAEPWKAQLEAKSEILVIALAHWKKLVDWMDPLLPDSCAKWRQQIVDCDNPDVWGSKPEPVVSFVD